MSRDRLLLWGFNPDPPRDGKGGPISVIVQAESAEGVLGALREIPEAAYLLPKNGDEALWLARYVQPIPAKDGPAVLAVIRQEAD